MFPQTTEVNHTVHHLCHTEAVPKVMKRIVPVILLDAQLKARKIAFYLFIYL